MQQLPGMRQATLLVTGTTPWCTKIDIQPANLVLRRNELRDLFNITADDHDIVWMFITEVQLKIAPCITQHLTGDIYGKIVDITILMNHHGSGNTFAASQFSI